MPNGTQAPDLASRETREMRYFTVALKEKGPLSTYIAKRRAPGPNWLTWERIVFELWTDTKETVTRAGLTNWAKRYGIPVDTRPTGDIMAYCADLAKAEILLPE